MGQEEEEKEEDGSGIEGSGGARLCFWVTAFCTSILLSSLFLLLILANY